MQTPYLPKPYRHKATDAGPQTFNQWEEAMAST
jgi:hypothetical protein